TPGVHGDTTVVARADLEPQRVLNADQVLVGRNATRRAYNQRMRERRGFGDTLPMQGDKLVCLRNNKRKGLFNGGLWSVVARRRRRRQIVGLRSRPEDDPGRKVLKVRVRCACFSGRLEDVGWEQRRRYDEFDFGYVLTVHKAQGLEWDDVVLFDESFAF